jgi:hypothetical protein
VTELTPPDLEQCQAIKPNGVTFMTLGGKREMIRCPEKAAIIATEVKPGKDGLIGSMSLCASCLEVFQKQKGTPEVTFKLIK